jgi:hypothetical protein
MDQKLKPTRKSRMTRGTLYTRSGERYKLGTKLGKEVQMCLKSCQVDNFHYCVIIRTKCHPNPKLDRILCAARVDPDSVYFITK